MARRQRVHFSLAPETVALLDENEDEGKRSRAVDEAVQEYYDDE